MLAPQSTPKLGHDLNAHIWLKGLGARAV